MTTPDVVGCFRCGWRAEEMDDPVAALKRHVCGHMTDYGFAWGPLEVTRMTERNGGVVLGIKSESGHQLQIWASRTGRSLRVWRDGVELSGEVTS